MQNSARQTRKKFSIWWLSATLALTAGLFAASQAARYTDTAGYFAERYINSLSDDGIISAEADGKFRPAEPITRAQLSAWMVKTLKLDNDSAPASASFADVRPTDWFYKPVELLVKNNYIAGYPDGFRPQQNIQRGEMISIIARGLDQPLPDENQTSRALARFSDKDKIPDWARAGIAQAELAGLLTDNEASAVNATRVATRGETAAIMARLSDVRGDRAVNRAISGTADRGTPDRNDSYSPSPVPPNPQYGGQQPDQSNYRGQVQVQGGYPQPPRDGESFNSQPYPQQAQYQPPQQQYGQAYNQAPLSGRVVVVGAGTQFQASLRNSLDSGATQVGEPVEATLASPLYANGQEVVPAGSKVIGSVTSVISARRFRFGANGKIDIKFNSIETPDGRKFPLSASVNDTQLRLTGGTTAGRVGKGLLTTGIGAGEGAALGTGLGAIVGSMSGGQVGRATGMGAVFGTAIGSGVGLVGAGVRKGSEVILKAGTPLPVQLDESMQVTTGGGYQQQQQQQHPGGSSFQGGYPPNLYQPREPQYQQQQPPPQQPQFNQGQYPPGSYNNGANNPY